MPTDDTATSTTRTDQIALVTGANKRIGFEIARQLASRGMTARDMNERPRLAIEAGARPARRTGKQRRDRRDRRGRRAVPRNCGSDRPPAERAGARRRGPILRPVLIRHHRQVGDAGHSCRPEPHHRRERFPVPSTESLADRFAAESDTRSNSTDRVGIRRTDGGSGLDVEFSGSPRRGRCPGARAWERAEGPKMALSQSLASKRLRQWLRFVKSDERHDHEGLDPRRRPVGARFPGSRKSMNLDGKSGATVQSRDMFHISQIIRTSEREKPP